MRWLVDFYPKMVKVEIEGVQYAWVNYRELLKDLPLLDIKKQALSDRFKKMCEFEILKHKTIKSDGTFSYYGFGKNYYSLIDTEYQNREQPNTEGAYSTNEGVCSQIQRGAYSTTEQNNQSTKDTSTKKTNKESKKEPSGYDAIVKGYTEHEGLRLALYEFIKMRKMIKKPLTDRALTLICNKLNTLANDDYTRQLILEQSISNCWQGVFPLRQENGYNRPNNQNQQNQNNNAPTALDALFG